MKVWLITGSLVAAVWLVAALVIHIANANHPTAATVSAYAGSIDLDTLQGDARARAIERMESMVNRLTFDERQQLDRDRRAPTSTPPSPPASTSSWTSSTRWTRSSASNSSTPPSSA